MMSLGRFVHVRRSWSVNDEMYCTSRRPLRPGWKEKIGVLGANCSCEVGCRRRSFKDASRSCIPRKRESLNALRLANDTVTS